jgi:uncharacterized protein YfaS (alpha-2-macroglobulin family)
MRKILSILLLLSLLLSAQNQKNLWENVENFEKKGLIKSALTEVQTIYKKAKKRGDEATLIKALLYQEKYRFSLQEDEDLVIIQDIEKELKETKKESIRLILTSILAELYSNYIEKNRYKIAQRSHLEDNSSLDIRTWDLQQLLQKSSQLYLNSLKKEAKTIPITNYQAILLPAQNSQDLRPTLYDFLAFRALRYLSNERNSLTTPLPLFSIREKEAFGSIKSFIKHHFKSKEKRDPKYQSLLIYQDLLKFHQKRKDQKALLHINFERLKFVYHNFVGEKKDSYYLDALKSLDSQYPNSEALYYLAKYYFEKGALKKSLRYANRGVKSQDSYLSSKSQAIKNRIEEQSISLSIEQVNLPNENILSKIGYKNISQLTLHVIRLSSQEYRKIQSLYGDQQKEYIQTLKSFKHLKLSLPKREDYKEHTTELSLGSYPLGIYLFRLAKDDNTTQNTIDSITTISNLAYFNRDNQLLVVNRATGEPLNGVEARFYRSQYNNQSREYQRSLIQKQKSNAQGIIEKPKLPPSYYVEFYYNNDFLSSGHDLYTNQSRQERVISAHKHLYLFTDRAIYRPSQTLYFKGLAVKHYPSSRPKILTHQTIKVSLLDPNGERVATKSFKTNEFGTFNGSFALPKNRLLGEMRLVAEEGIEGSKGVYIEEYKRPKFEINFKKPNKEYRLGDHITIKGEVKSYAGNGIDNAKVDYTIYRTAHFPWHRWWLPLPQAQDRQIASGELKSNERGEFKINFEALIDDTIPKEERASFTYKIAVDITDTTGERHSNTYELTLGSVGIEANLVIEELLNINEAKKLTIETHNLDGSFVPLKGKIVVEKFKHPHTLYRKRYWPRVDQPSYNRAEFEELFKHYAYQESQEERIKIYTLDFDTQKSKELLLEGLEQGSYLITLKTKDRYGTKVEKSKKIIVYDAESQYTPYPTHLWQKLDKSSYTVGSTAILTLKSTTPNSHAYLTIYRDAEIIQEHWVDFEYFTKISIPITKEDRGDLLYHINFIKDNRNHTQSGVIHVPWRDHLKIEYISFRDRLKPNEEEQWRIKISGESNEKIPAEMVATIYDASLDALLPHNFDIPPLFPTHHHNHRYHWMTDNFDEITKQQYYGYDSQENIVERTFYRLNWFGLPLYSDSPMRYYSDVALAESPIEALPSPINPPKKRAIKEQPPSLTIRKNLQESIFFDPHLRTNEKGEIVINFKTNGALSRWHFLGFAHSKDLKTAQSQKSFVTQKELMVTTNLPRFFKEGDTITLREKIVNMRQEDIHGVCELRLENPLTNQPLFPDQNLSKKFKINKNSSGVVAFTIKIPNSTNLPAIKHTFIAKSTKHTDAEQTIIPVLSNRQLITQSKPLWVNGKEERTFALDLIKEHNNTTQKSHRLTLEFSSNPAWYALRSLPYLMEYPHASNEQLFSRYFANALAKKVANQSPTIKNIFEQWREKKELKSPLLQNQQLKSILLSQTPWVLDAKNEEEQQQHLGVLFDLERLANEEQKSLEQLAQNQNSDGGWSWFVGGESDWYITQYIVEGFGKLSKLGIDQRKTPSLQKAINYIDNKIVATYNNLAKQVAKKDTKYKKNHLNSLIIHYLYTRSLYPQKMKPNTLKAYRYYLSQIENYWIDQPLYEQALIALTLQEKNRSKKAKEIVASLKERTIKNEEQGYHFKYPHGFRWNQMPIETHAMMIELFEQLTNDKRYIQNLKKWLLKKRQVNHWSTTKATTSAIYSLLSKGEWFKENRMVDIHFDHATEYQPIIERAKALAKRGSGYFQATFDKLESNLSSITIKNPNSNAAWGGIYYQYFASPKELTSSSNTPLKINRDLYLIQKRKNKEQLIALKKAPLHVGDKIRVRITLQLDRDMEYLMLKDNRASALEPLHTLSQYRWQDGVGYYENIKESATYFFFDHLARGTYLFEYSLFVTHKGQFDGGIATIESLYAPEFRANSKGIEIYVE